MGHSDTWEPLPAVQSLVRELQPEVVVATGDLAHRGRRSELETAASFLRSLGAPLLVVPGNHDIPYTFPARFTRPFAEWERVFGGPAQTHGSEHIVIAGLNSVRPFRQQGGALAKSELERMVRRFAGQSPSAARIVALHHHLAAPPWRAPRKRPLSRRGDVLGAFAAAGVELVIGGHVHQGAVTERREFTMLENGPRASLVLATCPGLGRPRPGRKEEVRGLNVYEFDARTLAVRTFSWDGAAFIELGRRSFARS